MGRVTEFVHFMNRKDIGLGQNPPERDYVYWTPWTKHKRWRYEYQKMLREQEKIKAKEKK
tara:strand:+ start:5014 stop:5193 length:180 start_codon:yes stop_codon:yes gene_type:complete